MIGWLMDFFGGDLHVDEMENGRKRIEAIDYENLLGKDNNIEVSKRYDMFRAKDDFPALEQIKWLMDKQREMGWVLVDINDDYSVWVKPKE